MAEKILSIGLGINTKKLPSDINEATKIVQDGAAKISGATGAASEGFKSLSQAVRESTKDAQTIAVYLGTESEAFKQATARAANCRDQLNQVNEAIVGSSQTIQTTQTAALNTSKSSYNGLGMSINQLTREMPAFTNSMQTGFMAISNNIPMLVDQINILKSKNMELAATGQPVKSILSQLGGALFSWNTAISLGVTALTVFGGKAIEYIAEQFDSEKATLAAAAAQKKQNENLSTYQRIINGLSTSVKQHNEQLRLEIAAKAAGISVDEMKSLNLNKSISEKEKLLSEKQAFLSKIDISEVTGLGKKMASDTNTVINNLKSQISALKDYQNVLKTSADLQEKLNQKITQPKSEKTKSEVKDKTQMSLMVNKPLETSTLKPAEIKWEDVVGPYLKSIDAQFDTIKIKTIEKSKDLANQLNQILSNGIASGLTNAFSKIGQNLGKGEDPFANLGNLMFQSLGNLMETMGAAMIAWGIAQDAFFKSLFAGPAGGITAIAAGIGLVAAGAALSSAFSASQAYASSGVSSSSANTVSAGTYGNGGNSNFNIGGMIRGNDILIAGTRSGYERNRIR